MKIRCWAPHPAFADHAAAYVVVDDRDGEMSGRPVRTAPLPLAALSVNFGDRSRTESGREHPRTALLGLQSRPCRWTAGDRTVFVMILLRPPGVMRLFRGEGRATAEALVELPSLWGDRSAGGLEGAMIEALEGRHGAEALDGWLSRAFERAPPAPDAVSMYRCLVARRRVGAAAASLGISARTLERRFRRDLGVSPRQLLQLERLQRSIREAQGGAELEPDDFVDDAHEIRWWRRALGTTPKRYREQGVSEPAAALESAFRVERRPVFYL